MTESLFTSQLPAIVNAHDSTYTLGTLFHSDVDGEVLGVRVYCEGVPTTTPLGLLYEMLSDTSGTLLASKPFGTLLGSSWNEILFDTPIAITAGTQYITAWGPTNDYVATGGFFDTDDLVNGHLSALRTLTGRQNGKFHVGTSAAYPEEHFNGGCYFVDTIFQLAEEGTVSYIKNSFFFGATV